MIGFKSKPKRRDALDRMLAKGRQPRLRKVAPVMSLKRGVMREATINRKIGRYDHHTYAELEKMWNDCKERMSLLPDHEDYATPRMTALKQCLADIEGAVNWPK